MFKNKKFGLLLVVLLLIVPMVLVACGDDDKGDGGNGGDADLNQSFEANGISVNYPDGWSARASDTGGVEIANSEDAFAAMDAGEGGGPGEGQAVVALFVAPLAEMGDIGAKEAFEMMAGFMADEEGSTETGEVTDVKIGDNDGFRVDISDEEIGAEGFVVGFEADGTLIIGAGMAATGELSGFEDTMMAIIGSATYSAPAE